MAWYECLYGGGGGDTTVHPVLIGQYTSNSSSAVTRTLTDSIGNYKYLWFSMSAITSDSVWLALTNAGYGGYAFVDVDYFRNNQLTLRFPDGSNTNGTFLLNYVDDMSFTSKASSATARPLYVYGIKDMPGTTDPTTARTLKAANDTEPVGTNTISEGLDTYKYIYMCRIQPSSSSISIRDTAFMSIDNFIARGSVTLGTSSTCTITYTNNTTITCTQSSTTQEPFVVLIK